MPLFETPTLPKSAFPDCKIHNHRLPRTITAPFRLTQMGPSAGRACSGYGRGEVAIGPSIRNCLPNPERNCRWDPLSGKNKPTPISPPQLLRICIRLRR